MKASIAEAKQELAIVEKRIAAMHTTRATVANSDASAALHALSMIDLDLVAVEADGAFLARYVRELSQLEEK